MVDKKITELTDYTPPIDTDVAPIVDITTSETKKITWANIKAALKTYFDGIYPTTRLASKIITATRDLAAANGDVAYTGVGFKPTSIFCFVAFGNSVYYSDGFADSSKACQAIYIHGGVMDVDAYILFAASATGSFQTAIIKSYDDDGFTLTYTKTATPTGTAKLKFLCFR